MKKFLRLFFAIILLASSSTQAIFLKNKTDYTIKLEQMDKILIVRPQQNGKSVEINLEDAIWIYALKDDQICFSYKAAFPDNFIKVEHTGNNFVFFEPFGFVWKELFKVSIGSKSEEFGVIHN